MSESTSRIPIPIKGISCQELLMKPDVVHHGYLRRRHVVNKVLDTLKKSSMLPMWPNCYVVLHDGCIYVYNNERSTKAVKACSLYGFLNLYECDESELPSNISWAFKLSSQLDLNNRNFYFSAPTQTDMGKWIDCIQEQMNYANNFRERSSKSGSDRSPGDAASASALPRYPSSSRAAEAPPPPPAARTRPVQKVHPKPSAVARPIPPPLPPPRDLVYEADEENHSDEYEHIPDNEEDQKKLKKGAFNKVVGTILSPLKISDKPRALEEPSKAADGNDQEDYMCPVTPPTVKPKPVLKAKSLSANAAVVRPEQLPLTSEADGYYAVEPDASNDRSQADEETAVYSTNEDYPTFPSPARATGLEPLVRKAFWYGDSREGEKLMRSIQDDGDGVYMIRSSSEAGKQTMMVRCASEVRKFHIMVPEDGQYSLTTSGPFFKTMTSLIQHYKDQNLPQRQTKLTQPYTARGYANQ